MSATRINISLRQFDVGISGALPDRRNWSEPAMDRGILEFVALVSGLVFKYGGRIVHGSQPALTPVILRQARMHAGPDRSRKPITLVRSDLWAAEMPDGFMDSIQDVAEIIITEKVGEGGPLDQDTRNKSLTAMRRVLLENQNVMIAVGGKMHSQDGMAPGVGEELDLAQAKGIPRFLVAGMGGYAAQYANQLTPSSLQNGLSGAKNALLFSTSDVSSCVNIILERLSGVRFNLNNNDQQL